MKKRQFLIEALQIKRLSLMGRSRDDTGLEDVDFNDFIKDDCIPDGEGQVASGSNPFLILAFNPGDRIVFFLFLLRNFRHYLKTQRS